MVLGLSLTLLGAVTLAWRDLFAPRLTWDTLNTEPKKRRKMAMVGFPLVAVGSLLQIVATASS